jgi:hypothetical protein
MYQCFGNAQPLLVGCNREKATRLNELLHLVLYPALLCRNIVVHVLWRHVDVRRPHTLPQEAGNRRAAPKVARIPGVQRPRPHRQVARPKRDLQEVPQRHGRCVARQRHPSRSVQQLQRRLFWYHTT